MKKRALSWLLAVVMVVSLAPQTIPWAKAADGTTTANSKTDAFGLPTEIDDNLKTNDLSKNPYGTKGWIPLFQNHELVVAGVHDDEFQTTYEGAADGKGEQMSSFRWSNSTEMGNINRLVNVAFDPYGTGRDEYIATLAFDDRADRLRLYVTNKDRKVVNSIDLCGGDAAFINELKFYQTRSMLCLTAGDFDGDGKDTLMVYVPGNNGSEATVDSIHEFQLNGSTLTDKGQKINLGDVLDQGKAGLKAMLYHDGNGSNELRAHLSVDMEAGDVDLDGIEELAMTVNVNDLKKKSYDGHTGLEKSYLTVYDGSNNSWSQKMKRELLSSNDNAQGRARFAGVTIGNFSSAPSDGVAPEVIAVGYYDNNNDFKGCSLNTGKLLLYSYQYQPGKTEAESKWNEKYKAQELSANGFTGTGTKGDDNQNPVAVAAVSADGAMTQEYLFVSGSMYKVGNSGIERCGGDSDMGKNRGIGGYIINNTGILDYAVGNFDGNKQGREQVYYVEYHKQETFDKEFLRIGQLYKEDVVSGETHTASENFKRWTDGWTYYGKKNCNVAITAADVNNDAVLAKIKKISYGYTDPKVMAILEASPHFSELDSFGNSATSIGKSKSTETAVHASGSFGFDVMAGFEYVAPLIETGGGIEFNTSHTFTVGGGSSTSKTVSIAYSNDNEEKNAVVMYATPMTYYLYDVKYPDGTPQKESTMMLAVPMNPVTSIVSVDTYNEAAAAYADMDQIGANVQLGTPGQPNTYRSGQPKAGDKHSWQYGEWKQYYGTGTITESIEKADSTSVSFDYEYEGSVQAYGIAGGFKAGGGYHWGVSAGTEKVSTNTLTKEGAVNCQNDPRYNFNWQFATWTVSLNGDDVPVLGYLVSNIVAPPSPAENLRLSEQTTDSMVLSWDSGARPAEYYKIYRYIEENKDDPFILVDTVDASEAASGSYEYKLTGLAANTKYQYAITSGYYKGNNESVESEIVAGKTLASDMERPTIKGPNKEVRAPLGESATFSVSVSGPAVYKSFLYRWQKREVGGKWENISGATSNTYTVDKVTSELNGAMFRCVVTGLTSSSEPIPFYSDAATLIVGMPTADAALDVDGHEDGEGTKEKPYIGQSDYLSIGQGTPVTETKITSYTATAADGTKLSVYKEDKTKDYIGIGTDASGNTVYYSVTANEDATKFTAGAKLNESTVYTWKNGDAALTVPEGTSPDTALTTLGSGEQAKTYYYQAVALNERTYEPTEYLYRDGEVYHTDGTKATDVDSSKLYLVHGQSDSQYILSRDETTIAEDTQGKETEGAGDTTETKYYELTITTTPATEEGGEATTTYALSNPLTYTAVHKIDAYTNPSFTLHQTETEETVTPETRKAGNGTALSLTTTTKNISNKNEPLSVDYTLTITNTSTGTVSTLTGKTGANGTDTKTWRAPIAGLYAITTTTAGGTASKPQYYLAGVQTVRDAEESETVYTLDSEISGEYGSPVTLTTRQQTIKKTGDAISAEPSSEVAGVTYKYRLSSAAATETEINGTSFDAPKAGTYVVSAYKDGKKLASTTINIKRKPVMLSVKLSSDEGDTQSYDAPPNKSDITFTGTDQLKTGDDLPNGAILINCDLYDSNGNKRDTSGRFEITLSLNNGEKAPDAIKEAIADLLEKYEFTFVSRKVISEQQTGTVAYSVGEGGTVVARKGANGRTFTTGTAVAYSSVVTFDATPNAGYMVKEWLVNGTPVTPDATGNYVLSDETVDGVTIKNKRLTVKSFSVSDLKDNKLTVEVKFGSDSHKITFSAGAGGSLTAKLKDGATLTNPQNVPEGAEVTFTAAPDNSKGVQRWTVDGNPYYWPGTTDLYRETTLTLKNISDDRTVRVDFTAAAMHTITTGYTTENAETVTGVSISAKLASGADAVLTAVPDGAAVTFTVNGLTSNHTVKEWLVDGETATGSNGQTSFTLRDIKGDHTVKAVIAVATAHTLTFKAVDAAGHDIPDESIAKLTATSRGTTIKSGSQVAAYTPIDFNVKLNDSYYVTSWENAQANESDKSKATLNGWNADTLVKVFIAKKPVVKFTGDENKITVTAKQGDKELTSGDWVEMSSGDIIFTATPKKGWETADWNVTGWTQENNTANDNTTYTEKGEITKDVSISVTAQQIPQYNLKLSVQDLGGGTYGGTVSANITRKQLEEYKDSITATTSDSKEFYRDSDIVITATPAEGYCVQEWTIDGVTTPTRAKTWTLPNRQKDAEVKVRFVEEVSGITFGPVGESSEEGYISAAVSNDESVLNSATTGVNIAAGQPISFTATAQPGYEVEGWYVNDVRDNDAGKKDTYKYPNKTSESSIYIEPRFQQVEYNITTGNHVTVNNQTSMTARGGTSLTFEATPPTGKQVTGWTVNGEAVPGSGNTLTWTVENGYTTEPNVKAYHVEAQFSAGKYSVTYDQPTGGTLTASVNRGDQVSGGTNVTFQATPNEGYEIDQWTVNGQSVSAAGTYTLNVTEDSTVAVSFKKMMKVTASVNGQSGEITITAGGKTVTDGWVSSGTDVTFTVTPNHTDDMVQMWKVNSVKVSEMSDTADAPLTWTVDKIAADTTVTATLIERPTYTITVTHEGNGAVAAEQTSVKRGGSTTIIATPKDTNYYLKKWVVDGSDRAASGKTLTLSEIRKDTRVKAVFDGAISYNVTLDIQGAATGTTVTATANGSAINPQKGSPANVVGGSELVFTASPATGSNGNNTQMVAQWTVKVNGTKRPELSTIANVLKIPSLAGKTEVTVNFVNYEGFAILTNGTGYTVTGITRIPNDTKPDAQIRKNGTVSFTVTPAEGHYLTALSVGGTNCLAAIQDTKTDKLTVVDNQDGSYTITVANVTKNIDLQATAMELRTEKKNLTIPEELKDKYKTVDALKTELRTQVNKVNSLISSSNIQYYDIQLQYSTDGGTTWIKATKEHFPANGITVEIPYADLQTGLDNSYTYTVIHMFTTDMKGHTVGNTESITPAKGPNGISFQVDSLSPFAIGWYKNTPTPGGGGGGGGVVSTYTLTFDTNGGSAIDKITKDSGTTIDLAAYKPTRAGYTFAGWFSDKALTKAVTSVKLTANTTVYAKWTESGGTAQNPFVDVKEGAYYYDAVLWAVEQKITSGTSATTFSPDASCTRAQMVTFLWRAAGSPKVENGKNPFADVQADAYYYDAVLWAVEKGVTSGTSATTFSPDATVTRGQTVTFLYRNAGSPEVSGTMPFTDVEADAYYAKAVQWAVQQKITTGTSETTFSPMSDCTRGQIVTFLYRAK